MTSKKGKKISLRFCALIVSAAFLTNSITQVPVLHAAESTRPSIIITPELKQIAVPKNLADIQDRFEGKGSAFVAIIQDAHSVPDAQITIRKTIEYFQKKYGIKKIGLEGVSGKLDTQFLRSFPDKKKLAEALKQFHQQSELAGGAAAALLNENADFIGLENWPLYEKGMGEYLAALGQKGQMQRLLEDWENSLSTKKKTVYSKKLQDFDAIINAFDSNQNQFAETLEKAAGIKMPEANTSLGILLKEIQLSSEDQTTADREIREQAGSVKKQLAGKIDLKLFEKRFQSFQTGGLDNLQFTEFLFSFAHTNKVKIHFSSALTRRLHLARKLHQVQGSKLFEELNTYLQQTQDSLIENDTQKQLVRETRQWQLYKHLIQLDLAFNDWVSLKTDSGDASRHETTLRSQAGIYFKFYETALQRDSAFLENLQKSYSSGKIDEPAIMVAGGFHAQGLTRLLKEQGISYLLMTPVIRHLPGNSTYESQMQGQVSWSNYFQVENGRVNLYKAFSRAVRDKLLESNHPLAIKEWRDQIIRELAQSGKIENAHGYTQFLDELSKNQINDYRRTWQNNIEKFIAGLGKLEQSRQLTEQNALKLLKPSTSSAPVHTAPLSTQSWYPADYLELVSSRAEMRTVNGPSAPQEDFPAIDHPYLNTLARVTKAEFTLQEGHQILILLSPDPHGYSGPLFAVLTFAGIRGEQQNKAKVWLNVPDQVVEVAEHGPDGIIRSRPNPSNLNVHFGNKVEIKARNPKDNFNITFRFSVTPDGTPKVNIQSQNPTIIADADDALKSETMLAVEGRAIPVNPNQFQYNHFTLDRIEKRGDYQQKWVRDRRTKTFVYLQTQTNANPPIQGNRPQNSPSSSRNIFRSEVRTMGLEAEGLETLRQKYPDMTTTTIAENIMIGGIPFKISKDESAKAQYKRIRWDRLEGTDTPDGYAESFIYSFDGKLRGVWVHPALRQNWGSVSFFNQFLTQYFKLFPEVTETHPLLNNYILIRALINEFDFEPNDGKILEIQPVERDKFKIQIYAPDLTPITPEGGVIDKAIDGFAAQGAKIIADSGIILSRKSASQKSFRRFKHLHNQLAAIEPKRPVRNVLIVTSEKNDNKSIGTLLTYFFNSALKQFDRPGAVLHVTSSLEAMRTLRNPSTPVDLVITQEDMSLWTGSKIAELIRTGSRGIVSRPDTPVVIFTTDLSLIKQTEAQQQMKNMIYLEFPLAGMSFDKLAPAILKAIAFHQQTLDAIFESLFREPEFSSDSVARFIQHQKKIVEAAYDHVATGEAFNADVISKILSAQAGITLDPSQSGPLADALNAALQTDLRSEVRVGKILQPIRTFLTALEEAKIDKNTIQPLSGKKFTMKRPSEMTGDQEKKFVETLGTLDLEPVHNPGDRDLSFYDPGDLFYAHIFEILRDPEDIVAIFPQEAPPPVKYEFHPHGHFSFPGLTETGPEDDTNLRSEVRTAAETLKNLVEDPLTVSHRHSFVRFLAEELDAALLNQSQAIQEGTRVTLAGIPMTQWQQKLWSHKSSDVIDLLKTEPLAQEILAQHLVSTNLLSTNGEWQLNQLVHPMHDSILIDLFAKQSEEQEQIFEKINKGRTFLGWLRILLTYIFLGIPIGLTLNFIITYLKGEDLEPMIKPSAWTLAISLMPYIGLKLYDRSLDRLKERYIEMSPEVSTGDLVGYQPIDDTERIAKVIEIDDPDRNVLGEEIITGKDDKETRIVELNDLPLDTDKTIQLMDGQVLKNIPVEHLRKLPFTTDEYRSSFSPSAASDEEADQIKFTFNAVKTYIEKLRSHTVTPRQTWDLTNDILEKMEILPASTDLNLNPHAIESLTLFQKAAFQRILASQWLDTIWNTQRQKEHAEVYAQLRDLALQIPEALKPLSGQLTDPSASWRDQSQATIAIAHYQTLAENTLKALQALKFLDLVEPTEKTFFLETYKALQRADKLIKKETDASFKALRRVSPAAHTKLAGFLSGDVKKFRKEAKDSWDSFFGSVMGDHIAYTSKDAHYILHMSMHAIKTKVQSPVIKNVSAWILETGASHPDDPRIFRLWNAENYHQYAALIQRNRTYRHLIFLPDVPPNKRVGIFGTFIIYILVGQALHYFRSSLPSHISLAIAGMFGIGLMTSLASVFFAQLRHFNAFFTFAMVFYHPASYRSAVAAQKIMDQIVPLLKEKGEGKPTVWMDWGALHADILFYLRHPGLTRWIVKNSPWRHSKTLDHKYIDNYGVISHGDIDFPGAVETGKLTDEGLKIYRMGPASSDNTEKPEAPTSSEPRSEMRGEKVSYELASGEIIEISSSRELNDALWQRGLTKFITLMTLTDRTVLAGPAGQTPVQFDIFTHQQELQELLNPQKTSKTESWDQWQYIQTIHTLLNGLSKASFTGAQLLERVRPLEQLIGRKINWIGIADDQVIREKPFDQLYVNVLYQVLLPLNFYLGFSYNWDLSWGPTRQIDPEYRTPTGRAVTVFSVDEALGRPPLAHAEAFSDFIVFSGSTLKVLQNEISIYQQYGQQTTTFRKPDMKNTADVMGYLLTRAGVKAFAGYTQEEAMRRARLAILGEEGAHADLMFFIEKLYDGRYFRSLSISEQVEGIQKLLKPAAFFHSLQSQPPQNKHEEVMGIIEAEGQLNKILHAPGRVFWFIKTLQSAGMLPSANMAGQASHSRAYELFIPRISQDLFGKVLTTSEWPVYLVKALETDSSFLQLEQELGKSVQNILNAEFNPYPRSEARTVLEPENIQQSVRFGPEISVRERLVNVLNHHHSAENLDRMQLVSITETPSNGGATLVDFTTARTPGEIEDLIRGFKVKQNRFAVVNLRLHKNTSEIAVRKILAPKPSPVVKPKEKLKTIPLSKLASAEPIELGINQSAEFSVQAAKAKTKITFLSFYKDPKFGLQARFKIEASRSIDVIRGKQYPDKYIPLPDTDGSSWPFIFDITLGNEISFLDRSNGRAFSVNVLGDLKKNTAVLTVLNAYVAATRSEARTNDEKQVAADDSAVPEPSEEEKASKLLGYEVQPVALDVLNQLPNLKPGERVLLLTSTRGYKNPKDFSAASGVPLSTYVEMINKGTLPGSANLIKISKTLKIDPVLIIEGKTLPKALKKLDVHQKIALHRTRLGMSQTGLILALEKAANEAGVRFFVSDESSDEVKRTLIKNWEGNRLPMPDKWEILKKVMGDEHLFDGVEPAEKTTSLPKQIRIHVIQKLPTPELKTKLSRSVIAMGLVTARETLPFLTFNAAVREPIYILEELDSRAELVPNKSAAEKALKAFDEAMQKYKRKHMGKKIRHQVESVQGLERRAAALREKLKPEPRSEVRARKQSINRLEAKLEALKKLQEKLQKEAEGHVPGHFRDHYLLRPFKWVFQILGSLISILAIPFQPLLKLAREQSEQKPEQPDKTKEQPVKKSTPAKPKKETPEEIAKRKALEKERQQAVRKAAIAEALSIFQKELESGPLRQSIPELFKNAARKNRNISQVALGMGARIQEILARIKKPFNGLSDEELAPFYALKDAFIEELRKQYAPFVAEKYAEDAARRLKAAQKRAAEAAALREQEEKELTIQLEVQEAERQAGILGKLKVQFEDLIITKLPGTIQQDIHPLNFIEQEPNVKKYRAMIDSAELPETAIQKLRRELDNALTNIAFKKWKALDDQLFSEYMNDLDRGELQGEIKEFGARWKKDTQDFWQLAVDILESADNNKEKTRAFRYKRMIFSRVLVKAALEARKAGRYEEALQIAEIGLGIQDLYAVYDSPKKKDFTDRWNPYLAAERAQALLLLNEFDAALDALEKPIALDPENTVLRYIFNQATNAKRSETRSNFSKSTEDFRQVLFLELVKWTRLDPVQGRQRLLRKLLVIDFLTHPFLVALISFMFFLFGAASDLTPLILVGILVPAHYLISFLRNRLAHRLAAEIEAKHPQLKEELLAPQPWIEKIAIPWRWLKQRLSSIKSDDIDFFQVRAEINGLRDKMRELMYQRKNISELGFALAYQNTLQIILNQTLGEIEAISPNDLKTYFSLVEETIPGFKSRSEVRTEDEPAAKKTASEEPAPAAVTPVTQEPAAPEATADDEVNEVMVTVNESGTAFTAGQEIAIHLAIRELRTEKKITEADTEFYHLMDPTSDLRNAGIKIFSVDGLEHRAKKIANDRKVPFQEFLIVALEAPADEQKGIYYAKSRIPLFTQLDDNQRRLWIEYLGRLMKGEDVSDIDIAPVLEALKALRLGTLKDQLTKLTKKKVDDAKAAAMPLAIRLPNMDLPKKDKTYMLTLLENGKITDKQLTLAIEEAPSVQKTPGQLVRWSQQHNLSVREALDLMQISAAKKSTAWHLDKNLKRLFAISRGKNIDDPGIESMWEGATVWEIRGLINTVEELMTIAREYVDADADMANVTSREKLLQLHSLIRDDGFTGVRQVLNAVMNVQFYGEISDTKRRAIYTARFKTIMDAVKARNGLNFDPEAVLDDEDDDRRREWDHRSEVRVDDNVEAELIPEVTTPVNEAIDSEEGEETTAPPVDEAADVEEATEESQKPAKKPKEKLKPLKPRLLLTVTGDNPYTGVYRAANDALQRIQNKNLLDIKRELQKKTLAALDTTEFDIYELSESARLAIDPKNKLFKEGVKIFIFKGLSTKIQSLAQSRRIKFYDYVVSLQGAGYTFHPFKNEKGHRVKQDETYSILLDDKAYEVIAVLPDSLKEAFIAHQLKFFANPHLDLTAAPIDPLLKKAFLEHYNLQLLQNVLPANFGINLRRKLGTVPTPQTNFLPVVISEEGKWKKEFLDQLDILEASDVRFGDLLKKINMITTALEETTGTVPSRIEISGQYRDPVLFRSGTLFIDLSLLLLSNEELKALIDYGINHARQSNLFALDYPVPRELAAYFYYAFDLKTWDQKKALTAALTELQKEGWDPQWHLLYLAHIEKLSSNSAPEIMKELRDKTTGHMFFEHILGAAGTVIYGDPTQGQLRKMQYAVPQVAEVSALQALVPHYKFEQLKKILLTQPEILSKARKSGWDELSLHLLFTTFTDLIVDIDRKKNKITESVFAVNYLEKRSRQRSIEDYSEAFLFFRIVYLLIGYEPLYTAIQQLSWEEKRQVFHAFRNALAAEANEEEIRNFLLWLKGNGQAISEQQALSLVIKVVESIRKAKLPGLLLRENRDAGLVLQNNLAESIMTRWALWLGTRLRTAEDNNPAVIGLTNYPKLITEVIQNVLIPGIPEDPKTLESVLLLAELHKYAASPALTAKARQILTPYLPGISGKPLRDPAADFAPERAAFRYLTAVKDPEAMKEISQAFATYVVHHPKLVSPGILEYIIKILSAGGKAEALGDLAVYWLSTASSGTEKRKILSTLIHYFKTYPEPAQKATVTAMLSKKDDFAAFIKVAPLQTKTFFLSKADPAVTGAHLDKLSHTSIAQEVLAGLNPSLAATITSHRTELKVGKDDFYKKIYFAFLTNPLVPEKILNDEDESVDNHFRNLGVPINASEATRKKSYKLLSWLFHPDRNPGDKPAEDLFTKIRAANETLDKESTRVPYVKLLPRVNHLYPSAPWYDGIPEEALAQIEAAIDAKRKPKPEPRSEVRKIAAALEPVAGFEVNVTSQDMRVILDRYKENQRRLQSELISEMENIFYLSHLSAMNQLDAGISQVAEPEIIIGARFPEELQGDTQAMQYFLEGYFEGLDSRVREMLLDGRLPMSFQKELAAKNIEPRMGLSVGRAMTLKHSDKNPVPVALFSEQGSSKIDAMYTPVFINDIARLVTKLQNDPEAADKLRWLGKLTSRTEIHLADLAKPGQDAEKIKGELLKRLGLEGYDLVSIGKIGTSQGFAINAVLAEKIYADLRAKAMLEISA